MRRFDAKRIPAVLLFLFLVRGISGRAVPVDDSIDSLPPGEYSARLKTLFQETKAISSRPIRFTLMSEQGAAEHQGRTSFLEKETVVEIVSSASGELRENLIAHELLHIVLKESDFNYATWVEKGVADQQLLLETGEGITGCVNDVVIDRRMEAKGFKPELLSRIEATNYEKPHNFPPSLSNNPVFVKKAGLRLYCLSQKKRDFSLPAVEDAFRTINPEIVKTADGLSARIRDVGRCSTAADCNELMKRIRDALDLPIKIVDFKRERLE
jgi:hypothetical protein